MKRWHLLTAIVLGIASHSAAFAQDCPPAIGSGKCFPWRKNMPRYLQPLEPAPSDPNAPPMSPDTTTPPNAMGDSFASAGQGGTQSPSTFAPLMFGDLLGGCVGSTVDVRTATGIIQAIGCMPSPEQAASFKIAESESPRPQNRIYYNFNYLGNIFVDVSGAGIPPAQLYRHLIGMEKTFFGGDASIGLRVPVLKLGGNPGYDATAFGDMSILMKYALVNNADTGNVLSGGMVMRVPTGGYFMFPTPAGARTNVQPRLNDLYFQPWGGYLYNVTPQLFVHGFHSVSIPTLGIDVLYMSNDIGVGYWLFRNAGGSILQGVVPTFEVHINTPFRNRTLPATVLMGDQISLTTGAYFMFMRGTLGGAVGVPVAGLHRIEALASYTMRW